MHRIISQITQAHESLSGIHAKWYGLISYVKKAIRDGESNLSQSDRVDLIYLLKGINEVFDDLRKETKSTREQLDAILCTIYVIESKENSNTDKSIKGGLASATPRLTMQPKLPSPTKHPTKYGNVLRGLGVVNDEVIRRGIFRIHWPSMVKWCTELAEEGKPFPVGINPSDNEAGYATTIRKRSDVDLEDFRKEAKQYKQENIKSKNPNSLEREDF